VDSEAALANEGLWNDPDIRWLTALSESKGVTYVNKECFEEMAWWLQLPLILKAASGGDPAEFEEIEKLVSSANSAALAAGYDLSKLREILAPKLEAAEAVIEPVETVPVEESSDLEAETIGSGEVATADSLRE